MLHHMCYTHERCSPDQGCLGVIRGTCCVPVKRSTLKRALTQTCLPSRQGVSAHPGATSHVYTCECCSSDQGCLGGMCSPCCVPGKRSSLSRTPVKRRTCVIIQRTAETASALEVVKTSIGWQTPAAATSRRGWTLCNPSASQMASSVMMMML